MARIERPRRPTMDDVARAAGVSKATVSRVLAGVPGGCAPATAVSVRETAARLGYVVNALAAGLRRRQTSTIGLMIADVSNPFFGGIAKGVEDRLSQTGYSLILGNTGNSAERERELVRVMMDRQIDGLILAPSDSSSQHLLDARQSGLAIVLVDSDLPGSGLDSVTIDNAGAARTAMRCLLDAGHRRIGIVTGPLRAMFDQQRLGGARAEAAERGITIADELIVRADLEAEGGTAAARQLLALAEPPSAVFVTNNMMALGFLCGLAKAGCRVPQDLSLLAFDDQDWYAVAAPPLTGVSNPAHELGYRAADRLLRQLSGETTPSRPVVLETRLLLRDSVGPVPRHLWPERSITLQSIT